MELRQALDEAETALARLYDTDLTTATPTELAAAVVRTSRLASKAAAYTGVLTARADSALVWVGTGSNNIADWLARRTGTSPGTIRGQQAAGTAIDASPVVADAVAEGLLSVEQAAALAPAAAQPGFDEDLVAQVAELSPAKTRELVEDWVARQDRDADIDRAEHQRARRDLSISKQRDGMYSIRGLLDPEAGARVTLALEANVDLSIFDHSGRSRGQRLADALVAVCDFAATRDEKLSNGRRRPTLLVTCDYDVIFERAAGRGHSHTGDTLTPPSLRKLCCDADLHRLVMQGRSTILDFGSKVSMASNNLYMALVARDQGCRHPGCNARASWCDVHHITHRTDGGTSDQCNCVLLCEFHHHLIHTPGWNLTGTGHEITITSPTAPTPADHPHDLPPTPNGHPSRPPPPTNAPAPNNSNSHDPPWRIRRQRPVLHPGVAGSAPRVENYAVDVGDYYLVTVARGAAWDYSLPRRQQVGWDEHAAFMDALAEEGVVVLGGPIGEGDGDDVLLVVDVDDETAIRARLADDPWADDLLTIKRVEPWSVWLRSPPALK